MNIDETILPSVLRSTLGPVLGQVRYACERFLIGRKGRPFAALIPIADLQLLEQYEAVEIDGLVEADRRSPGSVPTTLVQAQLEKPPARGIAAAARAVGAARQQARGPRRQAAPKGARPPK